MAKLLKEARERGVKPFTEEDLDAMAEVWPDDESIDDFLKWRREFASENASSLWQALSPIPLPG